MVDVNGIVKSAVKSGKVFYGYRKAIEAAKSGKAVALIVASNCSSEKLEEIKKFSEISGVHLYTYGAPSFDLGAACGKPFAITALTIREITEPEVLRMIKEQSEITKNSG